MTATQNRAARARPPASPGQAHPLIQAISPLLSAIGADTVDPEHLGPDDVPLAWDGVIVAGIRLPPTAFAPSKTADPATTEPAAADRSAAEPPTNGENSGLDGILSEVERTLAVPLADLDRAGKQQAVRMLEENGAFSYRKSVETVAAALGVSRFTVYNYLNRDRD